MKPRQILPVFLIAAILLPTSLCWGQEEVERPSAMRLFPYETLAFARVAHGRELYERFRSTGFGRMLDDPEVAPFIQDTWAFAGRQFDDNAAEDAGFIWEDLSHVPKGEIAIGVIDRGNANMGVLLLADFDGHQEDVDFFLQLLEDRWEREAMTVEKTDLDGETLTVVRRGDDRSSTFGYVVKQTCMVGSNDETLLRHVFDRWAGRTPQVEPVEDADDEDAAETSEPSGTKTLADNHNFQTIFRECSTQLEEPPQILFYVDPITTLRRAFRGNFGAGVVLATFPALGLDGVLGVGGTATFATEEWDSLMHLHVLLDNPRSGVLTLLRFEKGDITPPDYVPANAYGYSTTHVDAPGIYERLVQLVDQFRYDGAFEESIENNISEELGIDFREVLINNLAGQATLVTGYDEPPRPLGEQRALCATLVDPELAVKALETIAEDKDALEEREFGGVTYYLFTPRFARDRAEEDRIFTPCYAVLDDTLIATTSMSLLHQLIEAQQGTRPRLADSIEFKVIQSRVERLTRGRQLAMFYYENAAEAIRHWYEVSQSDDTRDRLSSWAENSDAAGGFLDVLEQNELPPFEVLQKYLAPTGGYLLDTDTGLHFMAFDFRQAAEE